jgi:predicted nucleic-acid-binding Zn-ribbon protein
MKYEIIDRLFYHFTCKHCGKKAKTLVEKRAEKGMCFKCRNVNENQVSIFDKLEA